MKLRGPLMMQFLPSSATVLTSSNHIRSFVSKGLYDQTLELYKELHVHGFHAISSILPSVIKACSFAQRYGFGFQLHCVGIKTGLDSEAVVSNSIISMYAKFSDAQSACKVFDKMPHRDSITWNSMINCYLQNGYVIEALQTLKEMYSFDLVPKPELLASLLSMCGKIGLSGGRQIHGLVIADERIEEKESVFLSTALMDFYFKCNDSLMASRVFDGMTVKNDVSWTAMISGWSSDQDYEKALAHFRAMQAEGVEPNRVTLIALLPACAELGLVKHVKEIHGYALHSGFESDHSFLSALINMYSKFEESFHLSELIFKRSSYQDVVSWSSMIGGYSQRGDGYNALKLFRQMMLEGTEPNSVTMLAVVSACTILSSLRHACRIHGYILKLGLDFDICLGNALINMYAKCGCLDDSHKIFQEMLNRDSVSWSTLISAYGLHGCGEQALKLFYDMKNRGMKPDSICFLAVLYACNHSGLVAEGQKLFKQISEDYKLPLTIEHYACEIDLLGRSGKLEDALEIVRTMPMKPSPRIWSSLVSSCKLHGRLDIAEMLAPHLIRSEPENAANYNSLNMIYAERGRWFDIKQGREFMKLRRLKKCYGFSQIETEIRN
ncbi:pentatricopeptide repeat-containing protein At4g31070, mitochondrial [Prosopis cineraria]|uniref:pentatricopeptide repeat-containing protein At4g31070, mitochondrial n=1 Tax=Prosopis cineraria TaxID=364024 RepID=UPI00240FF87D|nr:pentatricopeptide repeat-containing protein At4g31070, mitochondrial [Prosopis cineraria]